MAEKTDTKCTVAKIFLKNKSGSYKKLKTRAANGYTGLSNKKILRVTKYRQHSKKIINKIKPRLVRVKNIHVNLRKMKFQYKGKPYRYTLFLHDVFPRFHRLAALERTLSLHTLRELNKIFSAHRQPNRLHIDNGEELTKHVKVFCQKSKIKMIRCRSYNPRAQGILRQKEIFVEEMATCDINNESPESVAEKERRKNIRSQFHIPLTIADRARSFNDKEHNILFDSQGHWKLPICSRGICTAAI